MKRALGPSRVLAGAWVLVAAVAALCLFWVPRETFEESCRLLIEDESAYFVHTARKGDQLNLDGILNHPSCHALLRHFGEMPGDRRDAECRRLFAAFLEKHAGAMRTALTHHENPGAPANTQSLLSTQHALCVAMFITVRYGTGDALARQFAAIDEFRDEIEDRLQRMTGADLEGQRVWARHYVAPDCRFRMNTLLDHAESQGKHPPRIESIRSRLVRKDVPIATARATLFEVLCSNIAPPRPRWPNRSRGGSLRVTYDWNSDRGDFFRIDVQQAMIDEVRNELFGNASSR